MRRLEKAVEATATVLESQVGFGWFALGFGLVAASLLIMRVAL